MWAGEKVDHFERQCLAIIWLKLVIDRAFVISELVNMFRRQPAAIRIPINPVVMLGIGPPGLGGYHVIEVIVLHATAPEFHPGGEMAKHPL